MATLTVEIPEALKDRLDREVAIGQFKDRDALVQVLLEAGMRSRWKEEADKKIDEALQAIERGDVAPWKPGDCLKMGREYLQQKHARDVKS